MINLNIDTLLSLVDLDVDDAYLNPLLKIMLQKGNLLCENIKLLQSKLPCLNTSQQLRVLDYLLFMYKKIKKFTIPRVPCSFKDVLYSITILSLNPEILKLYEETKVCDEKLSILSKFVNNLEDVILDSRLIDFMRKSVSDNGLDEAHLDLLILLEFILRLRREGYYARLSYFYGELILDTNADFSTRLRDEVVDEYKSYGRLRFRND
ncbi:hypothetical protein [Saccharolobus caldissimus]|uniref:Uncharacterized protein n=1 Tax=Saccharolobus caldissimus TaxID=1702097 RepID=A0AAQ4CUV4_9CREN|nr:hypothetical protein [Saccharolobus caldissimus]BDB99585.1 hypothetical protein SACC_26020 [Saccharolobus caldissimus]